MKNKNIRNVPELRFPGFEGEWEKCKVRDIATTTIGEFVIKSKQNDSYPYPVYNGGRTNTGFYDKYNNEGNKILVSARGNAGFVNIIKTRYWAGNSCYSIAIIDKNKNNVDFTYYEMKLKENVFIKNQQSATIPSVSKSAVENFELLIPSLQEQTKIGSFLATIDALISETEKELEAYREQKHGMLQKMFPKNGETVPEIRFPGFTDAWEQRKLGDVIEVAYQGINTTADKVEYVNEGVPILQGKHITSGKIDYKDVRYLDKEKYEPIYYPKYVPKANDILLANIGTIGPSVVMEPGVELLIAWNIMLIRLNEKADVKFVKVFLDKLNNSNFYESIMRGNATKFINKEGIMNIEIPYPSVCEQQKIGAYFANLDNLITLHQRELDSLLELKKGFMQKMFC